jgi:hypothetical protein
MGPRHESAEKQVIVQLFVATQSMAFAQAPGTWQTTLQSVPPHVMVPQLLLPPHATVQLLDCEQSMPPLHAFVPWQST